MKSKLFLAHILSFSSSLFLCGTAFGQGATGKINNPLGNTDSLPKLISAIVETFIMLGTTVAALGIMYGGFLYVTAGGDEEKLGRAKTTMTWALVGTAVLLGSRVIAKAIEETIKSLN